MSYDLKNAEEVKEYIKNLHIEYKFGCFSEKNAEACQLLGDYTEAILQDFKEAAKLYKATCDQYDFPRSCTKYGTLVATGKGCEKNTKEAYKYLKKGCNLKDGKGCLQTGLLQLSKEDTGVKDRAARVHEGLEYLKIGCDEYQIEKGCYFASGLYLGGMKDFVKQDFKEAYKYSLKSCELGNPYACANISQMHTRGEGAKQDPSLAETFRKRADMLFNQMKINQKTLNFQQGT